MIKQLRITRLKLLDLIQLLFSVLQIPKGISFIALNLRQRSDLFDPEGPDLIS